MSNAVNIAGPIVALVLLSTVTGAMAALAVLPRFDRVTPMADGKVLDSGSVSELLERQPLFRDLWQRSLSSPATAAQAAQTLTG